MQWRNEIEAHSEGLKVLIWHGASRESSIKELKKYDVVCRCNNLRTSPIAYFLLEGVNYICCLRKVKFHKISHGWDTYAYGSCFRKQETGFKRKGAMIKEESPVHQIRWNRIIVKFHWFQLNQILTHSPARRSPQHQRTLYQYGKSSFRVEEWLSLVLVRDTPAESSWRTL